MKNDNDSNNRKNRTGARAHKHCGSPGLWAALLLPHSSGGKCFTLSLAPLDLSSLHTAGMGASRRVLAGLCLACSLASSWAGLQPGPDDIPLNSTAGVAVLLNATHTAPFWQLINHYETQVILALRPSYYFITLY